MAEPVPDYFSIWQGLENERAQANVIKGQGLNKDNAAKSLDMARRLGGDAEYILSHYDMAERAYKSDLTQTVTADNPMIRDYMVNHPLASAVSQDDIPNLHKFSYSWKNLLPFINPNPFLGLAPLLLRQIEHDPESFVAVGGRHFLHSLPAMAAGAGAGALAGTVVAPGLGTVAGIPIGAIAAVGGAGIAGGIAESWLQSLATQKWWPEEYHRLEQGREEHPYAAVIGETAAAAPFFGIGGFTKAAIKAQMPLRLGMAVAGAALEGTQEMLMKGELDAKTMTAAMVGGALFVGEPVALGKMITTGRFVTRHLENGEMPPTGAYRAWDKVAEDESKAAIEAYKQAIKDAGKSETKEISPESWSAFLNSKVPIGLKSDMVKKMYPEGKSPEPGDGLLGDVPGIQEKWRKMLFDGEDLKISFDDWSKVDPKVVKELADHVRVRPDLYTKEEMKEPGPERDLPAADNETQQMINEIRRAGGLDSILADIKEDGTIVFTPGTVLPGKDEDRIIKAILALKAKDDAKVMKVEKAKAETKISQEYNKAGAEHLEQSLKDVEDRPDFKAWRFMNLGEWHGEKIGLIPKIDPQFLTPEQRKAFPEHWQAKNGLNPDLVAGEMGFKNGDEFIQGMINFRNQKGKGTYQQLRAKVAAAEAQRRLDLQFGDRDQLTTAMAREHITDLKAEDLIWAEYVALGHTLGLEPPHDRAAINKMAQESVLKTPWKDISLYDTTKELGRAGKEAFIALGKGDVMGAYIGRQKMVHQLAKARYVKEAERRFRSDDRTVLKPFRKAEPPGVGPRYYDWAHWIMLNHGVPTNRSREHLEETLARPEVQHKTLEDFSNSHEMPIDPQDPGAVGLPKGWEDYGTTYNPNMPIWEDLFKPNELLNNDGQTLQWGEMTVRQRNALTNSLRALKKIGTDSGQNLINIRGKDYHIDELAPLFAHAVETFGDAMHPKGPIARGLVWGWRMTSANLKTPEAFAERLARYDEKNVWQRLFFNRANEAALSMKRSQKELARMLREGLEPVLKKAGLTRGWMQKKVENDTLSHPQWWVRNADGSKKFVGTQKDLLDVRNEHLVGLALSMGSEEAIAHTAPGYNLTPDELKFFASKVLKPVHYEIAKVYSDLFVELLDRENAMTMQRSGTILEKDVPGKVWTPFGERDGWYWPRVRDRVLDKGRQNITENPSPRRVKIEHGWAEPRTGQVYPVDLSLGWVTNEINNRLRYIHMEPVRDIFNKILQHESVSNAIYRKFGDEYNSMLRQLFNDMARHDGVPGEFANATRRLLNEVSGRGLTNAIGYNVGTFEKHGPQAVMQALRQIGNPKTVLEGVRRIFTTNRATRREARDFALRGGWVAGRQWPGSGELQIRQPYWKDDLSLTASEALGKLSLMGNTMGRARQYNNRIATYMLATVDNEASLLTWDTRYHKEMDLRTKEVQDKAGLSPAEFNDALWEAHLDAVDIADHAVRGSHGSTAITSKSTLLRQQDSLTFTMSRALNFMTNVLVRRYRMMAMTKDMLTGQSPRGAFHDLRAIAADMFVYFALPTLLEDLADPICKEDDDVMLCGAKYIAQGVAAPIPIVRDAMHYWITGSERNFGFVWNGFKFIYNIGHDVAKGLNEDDWNYGNLTQHSMELMGLVAATPMAKPGTWLNYIYKLHEGEERLPESPSEMIRVARWGRTEPTEHEEKHAKPLLQRIFQ